MVNKLSVCIATYNEQNNIKKCLQSVSDWVDEIVIVDGRSLDKTVEVAKTFGNKVKVVLHDNPANFLDNRRQAMKLAKSEWLLILDADERVSPKLKAEILSVIKENTKAGYWLPRLNYFLNSPLRKGGQFPDYCLRLVKRKLADQPVKTLHDQVAVKAGKDMIGYLTNPLLHYPYPSFEVYLRKWIQYSSHEADLLIKQKIKPGWSMFFRYCLLYPKLWFLKTYFRHKGFQDGFAGFVFAFFSGLRYLVIYIKLYEKTRS
ncbi:hypothetical protein A2313_04180 [Candidatus Roizmanbacteria bacterium RIFOXYB2_FULL_41_10]|uniref:Glycosyltransferase 2-like domain-containing protein n=1 Tax=Candidatus Roizmanbacteria bacterium RIFOXYA1_FULL_41_12 TaxID=1802082 RepID=A0A1F7KEY8_9BACT|nr:MAG: hypothetical protein A2209_01535 [Candidatus Roizmanbacteria bacterium RIFOXYA1_FULL_41_12]OGK68133.1 MAG: hypothetical protein A2377_04195 [Candidatus Roizmanbacteria bacterium RIFOXYB1_FULL_41_27]OGK68582.1 MAG: hypothetical protein A2262_02200 [Candidatus Roizmanbacteria bacterium RIFOXYA2_FULL_41_8]OGK69284.1 MAG: hypothetical protein A2313_04180 [Candidatus Roizmanbacteria bacterium RIFOXYB2_FULL_41_10]OGK71919.1 MAG: hypothetical protein A2403_03115 [Candidatus Roizmanbacteria bac